MAAPDSTRLLTELCSLAGLPREAATKVILPPDDGLLPSSFYVDTAAQTSIGAAAAAAIAVYEQRSGTSQTATVTKSAAELESTAFYRLDGATPAAWEKFSGLYPTRDGHVRIHANFEHHRDGVLNLLELGNAEDTQRDDVQDALAGWGAEDFETEANARGLVVSRVRTFDEWDQHLHAQATREDPLIRLTRTGDAPPRPLPPIDPRQRPLTGIRVLDLTRILAGPICGRTLAAYGAEVMLVNAPHLPNIPVVIDTSRGKKSVYLDLSDTTQRNQMTKLVESADVFIEGYRPGGLDHLGFSPHDLAAQQPGIVYVSLSAYTRHGPWGQRRGFDSLVQTATGFNAAEAFAAGADTPKPLPVQILDLATGFLMAFAAQAARLRQAEEGGSWHAELSLLKTADWLRSMGRRDYRTNAEKPDLISVLQHYPCSEGVLESMPHAAQFSATPATWEREATLPGAHPAQW